MGNIIISPEVIEYISNIAIGGYTWDKAKEIKKRWFDDRFGFQKENISHWFQNFNPNQEEQEIILENKELHKLFSYKLLLIQNEIYEDKLKLWSSISRATFNRSDKINYCISFIKIFENLSIESLRLLNRLTKEEFIENSEFMSDGKLKSDPETLVLYNSFLELNTKSLVINNKDEPNKIEISELGNEFLKFIKNEEQELN